MMTLTREKGNRMWGGGGASVAGGGGSDISGFASQGWVDENYLSKSFFSTLFIIHATQTVTVTDNQGQPVGEPVVTEITLAPNQLPGTTSVTDEQGNTTTTAIAITSIEATTNFYSDGGVSALGLSSGGGGGGATTLADLLDVNISNPTNGQVLTYNSTIGKWENAVGGGGGISMSDVWTALAASTSEQINASHLYDALNGYATQHWVGQQGYITDSALSGYATQQWVGQQGYITDSSLSGYATQSWVGQQGFLTSSDITNMVTGGSIFGNSFTGNPSIGTSSTHASLNYVSTIFMSGDIKMNNNKAIYMKDSGTTDRSVLTLGSGNVLVLGYGTNAAGYATQLRGATIDYYTYNNNAELHVGQWTSDGQLYLMQGAQGIRIGDGCIVWDSTNNALKIIKSDGTSCNLYATGAVSALGISSQ